MHSDVVPRHDRIDAMRKLYAQGDTDAALAMASKVASDLDAWEAPAPLASGDMRADPRREPVEGRHDGMRTAIVAPAGSRRLAALTSQKIPRRTCCGR